MKFEREHEHAQERNENDGEHESEDKVPHEDAHAHVTENGQKQFSANKEEKKKEMGLRRRRQEKQRESTETTKTKKRETKRDRDGTERVRERTFWCSCGYRSFQITATIRFQFENLMAVSPFLRMNMNMTDIMRAVRIGNRHDGAKTSQVTTVARKKLEMTNLLREWRTRTKVAEPEGERHVQNHGARQKMCTKISLKRRLRRLNSELKVYSRTRLSNKRKLEKIWVNKTAESSDSVENEERRFGEK